MDETKGELRLGNVVELDISRIRGVSGISYIKSVNMLYMIEVSFILNFISIYLN